MPQDVELDVDTFASQVRASRRDFARIHDVEAGLHAAEGAHPLHVLVKIASRGIAPANRAQAETDDFAFRLAFGQATDGNWVRDLVFALVRAGAMGVGEDEAALAARRKVAEAASPAKMEVELQAITNAEDGFVDPLDVARAFQIATRRVCEVIVDRGATARGTGFLVGPQAILTNWHVVRALFEPDHLTLKPEIQTRLSVRFDRLEPTDGVSTRPKKTVQALGVDLFDPCHPFELDDDSINLSSSSQYDGEERLDFALVRIADAVGLERGWYELRPGFWPKPKASLHVLQFPGQFAMRVATGQAVELCDKATRQRVRHLANALPGSSGGLCLCFDLETMTLMPGAIHQASVPSTNAHGKKVMVNQAVPLAKIAPKIQAKARLLDRVASITFLKDAAGPEMAGAPVLGRLAFQIQVGELVASQARIMIVRPPPKARGIGKSFSDKLLRSLLEPADHYFVTLSAADIPSDARALAAKILDHVEGMAERAPLPKMHDAGTTETAWIADQLLLGPAGFAPRLAAAARERLVWLVIDDLDTIDIPDAGGRRFLDALYQNIAAVPTLRIVLIGLMRDLSSIHPDHLRVEFLKAPPGADEVREWLSRRFGPERSVELDLIEGLSRIVSSVAGTGSSPAAALATAIRKHFDPHLPRLRTLLEEF